MNSKKLIPILKTILILSLLVSAVIGFSIARADTVSDWWGNMKWTLDDEGVLTIEGEGKIKKAETYPWTDVNYNYRIKKLIVGEGITQLAYEAFQHCVNLTTVELPSTLTEINAAAFQFCNNLTEINIPDPS